MSKAQVDRLFLQRLAKLWKLQAIQKRAGSLYLSEEIRNLKKLIGAELERYKAAGLIDEPAAELQKQSKMF